MAASTRCENKVEGQRLVAEGVLSIARHSLVLRVYEIGDSFRLNARLMRKKKDGVRRNEWMPHLERKVC